MNARQLRQKAARRQDRKKMRTGSIPGGRYSYKKAVVEAKVAK